MKNFIIRTITSIVFVVVLVSSFLYPETMVALFALITGMTIWEFAGLVNKRPTVSVNRFISTVAGVYFFLAMAGYSSGLTPSGVFIPYLVTLIYLMIAELYMKQEDPINDWAYTMFSQIYIALPFSLLNVLAFQSTGYDITYNWLAPLSIFIFLWINDAGAYIIGSLLGRHKLFPRISPGKSWEGSIGGAIVVLLAAWLIGYFDNMQAVESVKMMPGGVHHVPMLTIIGWMGLGLTVVIFGTWGDLIESLFKRTLGIKDSGKILPGHGGMLDRFDSTLMAIPAAVVYLYTLSILL